MCSHEKKQKLFKQTKSVQIKRSNFNETLVKKKAAAEYSYSILKQNKEAIKSQYILCKYGGINKPIIDPAISGDVEMKAV